jgi:hypothetical protein
MLAVLTGKLSMMFLQRRRRKRRRRRMIKIETQTRRKRKRIRKKKSWRLKVIFLTMMHQVSIWMPLVLCKVLEVRRVFWMLMMILIISSNRPKINSWRKQRESVMLGQISMARKERFTQALPQVLDNLVQKRQFWSKIKL